MSFCDLIALPVHSDKHLSASAKAGFRLGSFGSGGVMLWPSLCLEGFSTFSASEHPLSRAAITKEANTAGGGKN